MRKLLLVPEFIIHNGIEAVKEQIRISLLDTSTPETLKYLYRLTDGLVFQKYNFYEQAKSIFLKDKGNPKYLHVSLGFDVDRHTPPHVHITLAGDQSHTNSVAVGEGNESPFFDDSYLDDEIVSTTVQNVFNRRYKGTYDVVITTDNSNEGVMLSHIMRGILTSLIPSFSIAGLENLSISMQDLNPYTELVPKGIFVRVIRISLEYESSTLQLDKQIIFPWKPIELEGIPKEEEEKE